MNDNNRPNFFGLLIVGGLCTWGAFYTRPLFYQSSDWMLVPVILAIIAALCAVRLVLLTLFLIPILIRRWIAKRMRGRAGTSAWCSAEDIHKAGLRKQRGFLLAMHNKRPVFVDIESSGLVLSPAGGGKTVSFVVPALCHNGMSMVVPDLKGTLACMTKDMRAKKHRNKVFCVNPAGLYQDRLGPGACYNPLQILIDDWQTPEGQRQMMADAQAMAKQLCPDPAVMGENQYFRNGSRRLITFAFIYLVIMGVDATPSSALSLLSDTDRFINALRMASATDHLQGDLALFARDILTKFDMQDRRQIESFREGAVQSLEVFAPSGQLAESTSRCDFRFRDLRDKRCTVYLIADPTRLTVFAPWLGLLSWCALTELIRYQTRKPVCLLCDEITNFKVEGLPAQLTLAREFKIMIWLVVQELEQWAHVYGRESLETLLSQTEVKLIFGSRSHKTCELISNMLGDATVKSYNHNMGGHFFDRPTVSASEIPRKLLKPDEVRRFKDVILIVRNMQPIRAQQIGYHEVRPWSGWVGINPLYGKRFKGRTRLRIWYWFSWFRR